VTAKCVFAAAATQKHWTAGGLQSETDPGANQASACGMLVKLDGVKWVKVAPTDKLFDCSARYLVKGITTKALTAAKLDANRVATEYGTFTP
jgi:hypothetical protein